MFLRRSPEPFKVAVRPMHAFSSRARIARVLGAAFAVLLAAGCERAAVDVHRLPTGAILDPAGPSVALGSMPVGMIFSPDSSRIVAVLSGYREQGFQVIDCAARRVEQTVVQPSAFLGACFSPDGGKLFVSGGNQDVVYEYAWRANSATLADSIRFGPPPDSTGGHAYPSGLACSPDGTQLYVAENLGDALAVVDLASRRITQRLATGRYPYAVTVTPAGKVYVSAWGASWIACFEPQSARIEPTRRIPVGLHPSSMLLDPTALRLYVTCATSDRIAVVDAERDSVVDFYLDSAPGGPSEGSTPNGLALSPDGRRLYAAEADNDAIAVFSVESTTMNTATEAGDPRLLGRIPVEWYPTAVLARGNWIWGLNGKGSGTGPNPKLPQPGQNAREDPHQYTLGQTSGSLSFLSSPADGELASLSGRVERSNGWDVVPPQGLLRPSPFQHVVYIIRENRTFDQVLGDLPVGDTDSSLTFFPRSVTPNAHALAERFGVFDRFFVNGEVSGDGHNWSTAAYAADYVEKTIPSTYSGRGRSYDYDGLNRDALPDDDANEPSNGYLWDLARKARVSMRNYGEFTRLAPDKKHWLANKSWLASRTDSSYPGWDLSISDTVRAAHWIESFEAQAAGDSFPALTLMWLPNDHTAGGRAGSPTPRAYVAANDLSLGRIVEAISHSKYWNHTVIFVLEDDAQNGPDHVDSHRSPLLMISPYNHPGVVHRFANTSDVVSTIVRALGLGTMSMSKFDHFSRPLEDVLHSPPDAAPYRALTPAVPLDELNRDSTHVAVLSRGLDFSREDRADPELFNRVLWLAVKGVSRPYPEHAARPHS
jgi:YVTN family beta-propeller protein